MIFDAHLLDIEHQADGDNFLVGFDSDPLQESKPPVVLVRVGTIADMESRLARHLARWHGYDPSAIGVDLLMG